MLKFHNKSTDLCNCYCKKKEIEEVREMNTKRREGGWQDERRGGKKGGRKGGKTEGKKGGRKKLMQGR